MYIVFYFTRFLYFFFIILQAEIARADNGEYPDPDRQNESLDSLHDIDEIATYSVGDHISVTNETYKKPIAQVGGYEFKWAHEAKRTAEHYWICVQWVFSNLNV